MVKPIKKKSWKKALKEVQKDLTKKIGLFDRMGDECITCGDFFDKTDIEQVRNWHVAVRPNQEKVNLYCPDCWQRAIDTIKDFRSRVEGRIKNENS